MIKMHDGKGEVLAWQKIYRYADIQQIKITRIACCSGFEGKSMLSETEKGSFLKSRRVRDLIVLPLSD